jgi:hypothetical protein
LAINTGSVTAIGWLVNYWLTASKEEQRRKTEAQLKFVERQIEELYGPLAFLVYEGRRTYLDLLDVLGRKQVFVSEQTLPDDELVTWLFWTEVEFLPRNEKIKNLLMSKSHLIEGAKFPESYVVFLDHCNSWAINHRRWKEQEIKYVWHSKTNWPGEFEKEIVTTFEHLKEKHAILIGRLF